MNIMDIRELPGTHYPAGRITRPLVGGSSPIPAGSFAVGYVVLDPDGGQVPWHNHEPEETYFILSGEGELCVGSEKCAIHPNQLGYVPPGEYHQLTNIGDTALVMLYCCGKGTVLHGQQELEGTLPVAGRDVPPVPQGARSQKA